MCASVYLAVEEVWGHPAEHHQRVLLNRPIDSLSGHHLQSPVVGLVVCNASLFWFFRQRQTQSETTKKCTQFFWWIGFVAYLSSFYEEPSQPPFCFSSFSFLFLRPPADFLRQVLRWTGKRFRCKYINVKTSLALFWRHPNVVNCMRDFQFPS